MGRTPRVLAAAGVLCMSVAIGAPPSAQSASDKNHAEYW